jgi:hypothetical protein
MVFSNFTENSILCTDKDIVYSVLVFPPTSMITYFEANKTISWFTEYDSDIKIYEIQIVGQINAL